MQTKVKSNHGGFQWELLIPSNIDTEIHEGRDWEPNVSNWIRTNLSEGQIAIDIGANIGWFTLLMSKRVEPLGHVYAYEPEPSFRERLQRHIHINYINNVSVLSDALGDYEGPAYCSKNVGPYFSSATTEPYAPKDGSVATEVDCVRLDDVWTQTELHLMKIDVDGYEARILEGAKNVISRFSPKIAMEIAGPEPVIFLESLGYNIWREKGAKNITAITSAMVPGILNPGMPTINIYAIKG